MLKPNEDNAWENEEIDRILQKMLHLINFFSLPYEQQISLLPIVNQQSYDIDSGDLNTDKPLLALAFIYCEFLNKLGIRIDEDEYPRFCETLRGLYWTIDMMSNHKNLFEAKELETAGWSVIRQLSLYLKEFLAIPIITTSASLHQYLEQSANQTSFPMD